MATIKYIRLLLRNNNNFLFHIKDIDVLISNEILKQLGPKCDKLFEDIKDHMFDFETNHLLSLIKHICRSYVDVKLDLHASSTRSALCSAHVQ